MQEPYLSASHNETLSKHYKPSLFLVLEILFGHPLTKLGVANYNAVKGQNRFIRIDGFTVWVF